MCIDFPENFLFFEIENFKFTFEVPKTVACVGGGTGTKSTAFDASFVLNGGDNFEFAFGKLMNFDEASGFGPFSGKHELGRIGDPLDFVRSVIK